MVQFLSSRGLIWKESSWGKSTHAQAEMPVVFVFSPIS